MLNLLISSNAPYEKSLKLTDEVIIQNIKVSQTLISLSIGPLNHNIFIHHMKMHIDDITDLLKFVEATTAENKIESFKGQMLHWINAKTEFTARGVRSSTDGRQICHGTLTAAISELRQQQTQVDTWDTQSNIPPLFYYH